MRTEVKLYSRSQSDIQRHSCRAVSLCVSVPVWFFPRVGKESSDSENRSVCLSIVSVVACHSDKACGARTCGVGRTRSLPDRRWSLERGDLKSAAEAIFA